MSEQQHTRGGIIILTAPSGSGKTTIAHRVLDAIPGMRFSVSATTRPPRPNEQNGIDYHFLTVEEFRNKLEAGDLLEYEEVYPGQFYGTLRSEVERANPDAPVLLDIDVKGALNIKRIYGNAALAIFIRPPSIEALADRLRRRATETEKSLQQRLDRARLEMSLQDKFDAVVVNANLEEAVSETLKLVHSFLYSST